MSSPPSLTRRLEERLGFFHGASRDASGCVELPPRGTRERCDLASPAYRFYRYLNHQRSSVASDPGSHLLRDGSGGLPAQGVQAPGDLDGCCQRVRLPLRRPTDQGFLAQAGPLAEAPANEAEPPVVGEAGGPDVAGHGP